MPHQLVSAYLEAMPGLKAEETIDRIHSTAMGTGSMKKINADQYMARLQRRVSGGKPDRQSSAGVAAAMGIKVIRREPSQRDQS